MARLTTTVWLRAAGVIAILFACGHTLGAPWIPSTSAQAMAVVSSMKAVHFPSVGGVDGTYWNYYYGFGVSISFYLFTLGILTWMLGAFARTNAKAVRPAIVLLALCYAGGGFISWKYFFAGPLVFSTLIVLSLFAAFATATKTHA